MGTLPVDLSRERERETACSTHPFPLLRSGAYLPTFITGHLELAGCLLGTKKDFFRFCSKLDGKQKLFSSAPQGYIREV